MHTNATVTQAAETWVNRRVGLGTVSPTTGDTQAAELARFADHCGNPPITSITRDTIETWVAHLRRHGYANGTVVWKSNVLRTFFRDLTSRGVIPSNPCEDLPRTRMPASEPQALTEDVVDRLVNAATCFRDKTLIRFAVLSGFRVSELARMRVEHWNRDGQRLWLRSSKTGREHNVWIVGPSEQVLGVWVDHGLDGATVGPMWPSMNDGTPITSKRISLIVHRASNAAGLSVTCHQLRHTFADRLVEAGEHITTIQRLLRHTSLSSTQVYAQARDESLFMAMQNQQPVGRRPGPLPAQ